MPKIPKARIKYQVCLIYSKLKSGSYTPTPFFTKAMHIICGHTRKIMVKITEKIIPIMASAFEILFVFCGTGGKLSIPSLNPSILIPFLYKNANNNVTNANPANTPPRIPLII